MRRATGIKHGGVFSLGGTLQIIEPKGARQLGRRLAVANPRRKAGWACDRCRRISITIDAAWGRRPDSIPCSTPKCRGRRREIKGGAAAIDQGVRADLELYRPGRNWLRKMRRRVRANGSDVARLAIARFATGELFVRERVRRSGASRR